MEGEVFFDSITKEATVETHILPEKDKIAGDPTIPQTYEVEGDEPEIELEEGDTYKVVE